MLTPQFFTMIFFSQIFLPTGCPSFLQFECNDDFEDQIIRHLKDFEFLNSEKLTKLGEKPLDIYIKLLRDQFTSKDVIARIIYIGLEIKTKDERFANQVFKLLTHKDAIVRISSCQYVAFNGSKELNQVLISLLYDKNTSVVYNAAIAIEKLGDEGTKHALKNWLRDVDQNNPDYQFSIDQVKKNIIAIDKRSKK